MFNKHNIFVPSLCLLLAACSGGDPLSSIADLQPEPTAPTNPGPPPPKPQDNLATSPPSGMTGRIVFLGQVNNEFGSVHMFLTLPDGSNTTSLNTLADPFSYTGPSWGPNGDKLVIASNQLGNAEWDIYTINADGSGVSPIVAGPSSGDFAPSWSPDGSKIVFQSTTDDALGFDIYLYDVDTQAITNLTNAPGDDELPSWSPDGTRVLFQGSTIGGSAVSSGTNLFLISPDGTGLVALTSGVGVQNSAGMFSPDGAKIVYESTAHSPATTDRAQLGDFEIYVMNADGTDPVRLTTGVGTEDVMRFPTWSPDGRHIAFEFHDFTANQLFSVTFIAVMNSDGSNIYLLPDLPVDGIFPRWGP